MLIPKITFENNMPLVNARIEKRALNSTTEITPFITLGIKR
jgi:hypothetical protein